ncbi:MAG: SRPBCC family protein [Chloroflexota bacterium]
MTRIRAEASAIIDASPEAVYSLIADYRNGHPRILPQEHFRDLVVEEGGIGEGTVISFVTRAGGQDRKMRGRVSEPQPGRVLVESYTASDLVTTFTLTPQNGGKQTSVQIATEQSPSPGLRGMVERLMVPRLLQDIYRKELAQLAEVMKSTSKSGSSSSGTY